MGWSTNINFCLRLSSTPHASSPRPGVHFAGLGVDEDENACWASLACWIESGISTLLLMHVVVVPGGYCWIDEPTSIPHCSKQGRLSCGTSQSYFPWVQAPKWISRQPLNTTRHERAWWTLSTIEPSYPPATGQRAHCNNVEWPERPLYIEPRSVPSRSQIWVTLESNRNRTNLYAYGMDNANLVMFGSS